MAGCLPLHPAPMEIKFALMLARFGGLRGQSIIAVGWKQYVRHDLAGMCFRLVTRKNKRALFLPAMRQLQIFLAGLKSRSSTLIAVRDDGTPWPSEKEMQTRVSHFLRDLERDGLVGDGTTLHGLRVSYAAWWKRTGGASNSEVADLLGDESENMGKHYTRHVDAENNVIRASTRVKDKACTGFAAFWKTDAEFWKTSVALGRKTVMKQRRGRGGTGRRKGLKIPRWQRRVGSSPTARTKNRQTVSFI
jgi:integrase